MTKNIQVRGLLSILFLLCSFMFNIANAQTLEPYADASAFNDEIEQYLSHTVSLISVFDLRNNKKEYVILDTREAEEFNTSHIPNAINVGYDHFDIKSIEKIGKDKMIVLYCSIGYRSEKVGEKLKKAGYKNVFNLYGSIFQWANEGFPIVDSKGSVTTKLHTYNRSWSKWVVNEAIQKVW